MTRIATTSLFWLTTLICLAVALFSARFLLPSPILAEAMAPHIEARPIVFLAHVTGGVTALSLGMLQLATRRGPRRRWHRQAGRIYVVACLTGAATGLALAATTPAGPVAGLGFGLLAVAWFGASWQGWRTAVRGEFDRHRRWMSRSLALTFAALTLRAMIPFIPLTGLDFVDGYAAVAFLCWIPNLLAVEAWLRTWGRRAPAMVTPVRRPAVRPRTG